MNIKLLPSDDNLLRQMHRESRRPVDQWAQLPKFQTRFEAEWHRRSGRHDTIDELRHYIITQRKQKKWFTFGDDYDRLASPGQEDFTSAEWEALRIACIEINVGRDQFAANENLRDELADKFHVRTGKYVSGERLYAAAMAQQKHSENGWPRIDGNRGFKDIGEIG